MIFSVIFKLIEIDSKLFQINALVVIRELGITNLYRGIRACWMRDISYASIFFPLYANAKLLTADEKVYLSL